MRALVAMSGGVDSAVAAALLVADGHEVVGVTLKQWQEPDGSLPRNGCCTVADAEDARMVAGRLGIPYYVLDYTASFHEDVVAPFAAAYAAGATPNPCIECNRKVRFTALLERAEDLGCDVLATGHHARIAETEGGFRLLRGADPAKDQSYVLHMLGQDQLRRVRFPVGDMTKNEVRGEARRLGLRVADKPDSQEICFVGGDYRDVVARLVPEASRPGAVVDEEGRLVGRHGGVAGFTIGQRRGLGVAVGEPRYVTAIDPVGATVTIGSAADLTRGGCTVRDVTFVAGRPPPARDVEVKIRYRSDPVPATLDAADDERWQVRFTRPQPAVAPGQSAVFYRGAEVLGGGIIAESLAA